MKYSDIVDLLDNKEAEKKVLADVVAAARKANLKDFEIVKAVVLVHDEWTPDNGMLTAAMKLQRAKIYAKYRDLIDAAYSS